MFGPVRQAARPPSASRCRPPAPPRPGNTSAFPSAHTAGRRRPPATPAPCPAGCSAPARDTAGPPQKRMSSPLHHPGRPACPGQWARPKTAPPAAASTPACPSRPTRSSECHRHSQTAAGRPPRGATTQTAHHWKSSTPGSPPPPAPGRPSGTPAATPGDSRCRRRETAPRSPVAGPVSVPQSDTATPRVHRPDRNRRPHLPRDRPPGWRPRIPPPAGSRTSACHRVESATASPPCRRRGQSQTAGRSLPRVRTCRRTDR